MTLQIQIKGTIQLKKRIDKLDLTEISISHSVKGNIKKKKNTKKTIKRKATELEKIFTKDISDKNPKY